MINKKKRLLFPRHWQLESRDGQPAPHLPSAKKSHQTSLNSHLPTGKPNQFQMPNSWTRIPALRGGGSSSGRDLSMAPPISPVGLLRGGPGTIWQRRQTRTHSPDVLSTPPTPGIPESTCQINLPWIPGPGHTQSKLNFTRLSSKGSLTTGKVICCAKPELASSS